MLKRHLKTRYDMTPEEYRKRWGLPDDYPMVAPSYAQQRSALAKKIGLGTKPRARGRARAGRLSGATVQLRGRPSRPAARSAALVVAVAAGGAPDRRGMRRAAASAARCLTWRCRLSHNCAHETSVGYPCPGTAATRAGQAHVEAGELAGPSS